MRKRTAYALLLLLGAGLIVHTIAHGAPAPLAWNVVFGSTLGAAVALTWGSASIATVVLPLGAHRRTAGSIVIGCSIANGGLAFPAFGVFTGVWVFAAWGCVARTAWLAATGDL